VLWDIEHDRDAESSSSLIAGAEGMRSPSVTTMTSISELGRHPQEFGNRTAPIANKIFSGAAIDVG
jgi:hypothetical protein